MEKHIIINVGRQLGSGGRIIGNRIAQDFGIKFYDKELLDLAAKESGFDKRFFERNDEHKGFLKLLFSPFAPLFGGTNPYAYFRWMLDDMTSLAAVQLAPRHSSVSLTLMENKPKAEAVEDAYKLAGDGYISQACILFTQEWERSGHLPSGYNAALLTAASGDLDGAIAILEEISSSYDSAEVDSLLSGLRDLRSRDSQARQQLNGEGPMTNYTDSDTSIFSVVMGA